MRRARDAQLDWMAREIEYERNSVATATRFLLEAARPELSAGACSVIVAAARARGQRGRMFWALLNALDPECSVETLEGLVWTIFHRGVLIMVAWFVEDSAGQDLAQWTRGFHADRAWPVDAYRHLWRAYVLRLPFLSFAALGLAVGRFAETCSDAEFEWLCDRVRERATEGELHYLMRYEEPNWSAAYGKRGAARAAARWRQLWFRALAGAHARGLFCRSPAVQKLGREGAAARRAALAAVRRGLRHSRDIALHLIQQYIG